MSQPPNSPPSVGARLWDYIRFPPGPPTDDFSPSTLRTGVEWMITAQDCFHHQVMRALLQSDVRQFVVLSANTEEPPLVNPTVLPPHYPKLLYGNVRAIGTADAAVNQREHFDMFEPIAYLAIGTLDFLPDDEFAKLLADLGTNVGGRRYLAMAHLTTADLTRTLASYDALAPGLHPRGFRQLVQALTTSPFEPFGPGPTTSWSYLGDDRPAAEPPDFCWVGYADPPIT